MEVLEVCPNLILSVIVQPKVTDIQSMGEAQFS
jgi:hypothetical protein